MDGYPSIDLLVNITTTENTVHWRLWRRPLLQLFF